MAPGHLLTALLLLAFSCGAISLRIPQSRKIVIGSGSSLAAPVLGSFASFINKKYGTKIRYNDVGSGTGRSQFIGSSTLFCGTSVPMSVEEEEKIIGYIKFTMPLAIDTITVFTSLRGASNLRLDAPTVAKIFSGTVTKWNDPAIKALNPKLLLPASTIKVAVRKDDAGATSLFTQWLAVFAKQYWKLGTAGRIKWPPHVVAVPLNDGVLKYLKKNRNAITYAAPGPGNRAGLPEVALKNRAGQYILASQSDPRSSVPRTLPPTTATWSGVDLIGKPGKRTWPITSFLYILARKNQVQVGVPGGILKAWLLYIMSPAVQPVFSKFLLTPVPASVLRKNRAAIASIQITPGVTVPNFK